MCRGFGSCSHFARWLGDGSNLVGAPDNACLSHQMQHLLYLEEVRDELMANGCTGSSILVRGRTRETEMVADGFC